MATPIDPQTIFMITRIIGASLTLIVILTLSRKFRSIPLKQRPLLHKLFMLGLLGWLIYITCDFFIYGFAAVSFNPNVPIRAEGYYLEYPSLFIANILRDFAIAASFLQIWGYYFSSNAIYLGEARTREQLKSKVTWAIMLILSVPVIIIDKTRVQIEGGSIIIGSTGSSITDFIQLIVPIVMFNFAAYRLSRVLKNSIQSEDINLINNVSKIRTGISMMGFSYVWYFVGRIVLILFDLRNNFAALLFVGLTLHLLWICSPVFLYFGLKSMNNKEANAIPAPVNPR